MMPHLSIVAFCTGYWLPLGADSMENNGTQMLMNVKRLKDAPMLFDFLARRYEG
jgi:hypothetical protein